MRLRHIDMAPQHAPPGVHPYAVDGCPLHHTDYHALLGSHKLHRAHGKFRAACPAKKLAFTEQNEEVAYLQADAASPLLHDGLHGVKDRRSHRP